MSSCVTISCFFCLCDEIAALYDVRMARIVRMRISASVNNVLKGVWLGLAFPSLALALGLAR